MDPELGRALFSALIVVAIMLLVGFPVHEFMHAWTAYRLGDSTARWQGRLSLDPRVHLDQAAPRAGHQPSWGYLRPAGLLFGWAKPTPVNPLNIRYGRRGQALVAVAGPASNLVMAMIVAIPIRIALSDSGLVGVCPRHADPGAGTQRRSPAAVAEHRPLRVQPAARPAAGRLVGAGWPRAGLHGAAHAQLEIQYASLIPILFLAFVILFGAAPRSSVLS